MWTNIGDTDLRMVEREWVMSWRIGLGPDWAGLWGPCKEFGFGFLCQLFRDSPSRTATVAAQERSPQAAYKHMQLVSVFALTNVTVSIPPS